MNYTLSQDAVTVFSNGARTFLAGTIQYNQIREAILKQDFSSIPGLLTSSGALARYLGSEFVVDGTTISYQGVTLPTELSARIQKMATEGHDPSPLLRFYERLHLNPSFRSREQVFKFLEHLEIAVEPDGTFLGYKGVEDNYLDKHSGTIDNTPGQVIKMARNLISDDFREGCHQGLHVGSRAYAEDFASTMLVVRVDPANVVCVPEDCSFQKMRVCEYEVVGEWSGQDLGVVSDEADLPYLEDWDDEDDLEESYDDHRVKTKIPVITIYANPMDSMNTKALMEQSLDDLRRYASGRLTIHGASKIPGGKAALVSKIMAVRRKRLR